MTVDNHRELIDVKCDYCGSGAHDLFLRVEGTVGTLNTDLVKCASCGLVYITPRMMQRYENLDGEANYFDAHENLDIFKYFYDIIARWKSPPGKFLDIGCGAGYLLNMARAHGWKTVGVDMWKALIHVGRRYLKLDIREGTLFDCRFEDASFDVAAMTELIEHVPSPSGLLREVNRILKPSGVAFITTPNIASKSFERLGEKWTPQIDPSGHVYYFSIKTLSSMLEKEGFAVLDIFAMGGEGDDEQLIAVAGKPGASDMAQRAIDINLARRNAALYKKMKRHWFFSVFIKLGNHFLNYPAEAKLLAKSKALDDKRYERIVSHWLLGPVIRAGEGMLDKDKKTSGRHP